MTALVLAEHDNKSIKGPTLNTVTAAAKAGGDVHVLVVGHNAADAAQAAARIGGVSKVLLADGPQFADGLAEPVSAQVLARRGQLLARVRAGHGVRQERDAAHRGQAGCRAGFGHHQR